MEIGFRSVAVAVCVLSFGSVARPCEVGDRPRPALNVGVYDEVNVPPEVADQARKTLAKIFQRAGVELAWHDPAVKPRSGDALLDQQRSRDFLKSLYLVRLVPLSNRIRRNPGAARVLGFAVTGTQVATVVYRRVTDLAGNERRALGAILGHVVAHELGHLLLRQSFHSAVGLMHARLDVPLAEQGRLLFTEDQAQAIRRALAVNPCAVLP